MRTGLRSKIAGGFGIVTVGLLATSTAYACTTYKGKLTASGNGAGSVTQTVNGTGSGMNWCANPTPTVKVTAGTNTATLTLVTGATAACSASNKMKASGFLSTYSTAVTNTAPGYMPQGGGAGAVHNCHGTSGAVVDTNGTVNSSGVWSKSGGGNAITFTTVVGPQSVCIYNVGALSGPDAIAINFDGV